MSLAIATWNINSVRLRIELVLQFLKEHNIDILCLQETKCHDDSFPLGKFKEAGYEYTAYYGEKSYNGVAIISKVPLSSVEKKQFCDKNDCRHISAIFDLYGHSVLLHNFYVPAGGDIPNADLNPKFKHKLDFLQEMQSITSSTINGLPSILVGDLNIAPLECDVWSHKQLLDVVSHTPIETETLLALLRDGNWVDLVRHHIKPPQKIYSWWSYRAKDWRLSNRGRRLDHIWVSPELIKLDTDIKIMSELRGAVQPSDHVPLIAYFNIT